MAATEISADELGALEGRARVLLDGIAVRDIDSFVLRLRRFLPEVRASLIRPYGVAPAGIEWLLLQIVDRLASAYRDRPEDLRIHDLERSLVSDWFQLPSMVGYVCYVDRFSGTLNGVADHVDYLKDLGVQYLHLMPVLRPRDGDSDGGYAVADYRDVDPMLGSMPDLEDLCRYLRVHGISVCIDFVLNHTAAEHEWARRAASGDAEASARYLIFRDRRSPNRYEATLPEVFPDTDPGNFTQLPDGRWVWTTFRSFQWDLNWANPNVFVEMLENLLWLANRGIDAFRLDAVPFLWKRLGTDCQNQPEVHDLLTALRSCVRIAAPAVIFKAEAIVGKAQLAEYLGTGQRSGRECDLAYHNSLMVHFWSALATRDARLMTCALDDFPPKPAATAWATYVRCHDDVGWAIADADAAAVGWDGHSHRKFLSEFYSGDFPGSFARGERFQENSETGDSRISGTFASLAGLEAAITANDATAIDLAIDRIVLGNALILAWDGLPLLYMGDEIGLLNDRSYLDHPERSVDNRWLHRPPMNWGLADERSDPDSIPGRLFRRVAHLVETRRRCTQLHAATPLRVLDSASSALFAFVRDHPVGPLLAVYNMTDRPQMVPPRLFSVIDRRRAFDAISGQEPEPLETPVVLDPYGFQWWIEGGSGG
jgi:amylosucrase